MQSSRNSYLSALVAADTTMEVRRIVGRAPGINFNLGFFRVCVCVCASKPNVMLSCGGGLRGWGPHPLPGWCRGVDRSDKEKRENKKQVIGTDKIEPKIGSRNKNTGEYQVGWDGGTSKNQLRLAE